MLYPEGLEAGQLVRVEYNTEDPELARVAGRSASLTLLPLGTTILFTWLVAGPAWWFSRRRVAPVGDGRVRAMNVAFIASGAMKATFIASRA